MSIAFEECVDEEDWIIIDLKTCENRSLKRNQLQKLDLSLNVDSFADTTWNLTKLPPNNVKFQELSNNMQIRKLINIEFKMFANIVCTLV